MLTGINAALQDIHVAAEQLVRIANGVGVVVTIEQVPLKPLRMGNYETVVSVRPVAGRVFKDASE